MDTKKKIIALAFALISTLAYTSPAQEVNKVKFCDYSYSYKVGRDSINLYLNFENALGERLTNLQTDNLSSFFRLYEDGSEIESERYVLTQLEAGVRIPKELTFSIVLDRSIAADGKNSIWNAVESLIDISPDSCVYVSFYDSKGVTNSILANKESISTLKDLFMAEGSESKFYSAVYGKLAEFVPEAATLTSEIESPEKFAYNEAITQRAKANPEKNILMLFVKGSTLPIIENLDYIKVRDLQKENINNSLPRIYAFYYTEEGEDMSIDITLTGITAPRDKDGMAIDKLRGAYHPSDNMQQVISLFENIVNDETYDYRLGYAATSNKVYDGNVDYLAKWGNNTIGTQIYAIGSPQNPWPVHPQSLITKIIAALIVTGLTFIFFFFVIKIIVPWIGSLSFKKKYYKHYVPEQNIARRICHYCKQEIRPGQVVVARCKHWMHQYCWVENGYKCAEFGQNCREGIQNHVDWKEMFQRASLRECGQTLSGILAGLISWIIYEVCPRDFLNSISSWLVGLVISPLENKTIFENCVNSTSSLLMVGLLLGFFISLVFRYKDEIKDKDFLVWIKIIGLSLLTGIIGMVAFAIGADIFCIIVAHSSGTPWYCTLPAYLLFSLAVSLALTIKSTIPIKSALLGGACAAIIGFLVLYFAKPSPRYPWLNMLLDFIIYGGGLGASLVTVRMLAEKYFLVIQNGIKAGQRIPIHKWMNATGGGNKVSIGMTGDCEIQMNWEKSNKVAKEHAQLFIDHERMLPVIKPLATGVIYNNRAELACNKHTILSNGDTFKIGDTIFKYEEV